MISSVYGKTMENLRKRISGKVVNNEKDQLKHVSKPTSITTLLKEILMLNCYLLTQTVLLMK